VISHGHSRLCDDGEAGQGIDVDAAPMSSRGGPAAGTLADARREIETLRSINAHLFRQIALLEQREAHAQQLADRDGLTGLYNRRRMRGLVEGALDTAMQHGHCVGLLFIDLDAFKAVNDRLGHLAGDQLLMMVAARIAGRARAGDFVCRYGGDEFVVILPRVADLHSAGEVAGSIRERLSHPYWIERRELRLTAAIGVALYPDAGRNAADLLRAADESMYREKSGGTDRHLTPCRPGTPARRRDDEFNSLHSGGI
jgi:diguanylate cyclase (GGDEF)-like protein